MKISTKGKYALEIVLDMALHAEEGKLESIKSIAARRNLSEKYLERIVGLLRNSGIVCSVRGAYGGYCLAKPLKDINVTDVLLAAEGSLYPVECLEKESACMMDCDKCSTRQVWFKIWLEIKNVTDHVTLENLVNESLK